MKLNNTETNVLSSHGISETKAFSIKTSAHAFKLLSSGLYSNKIEAVLREIGCNAHDAHILAGKSNTQFVVKLPNPIDQEFYIQDSGPGLSHDDVLNLYTTYFDSTKQLSNDFTGAYGLGSKSPFSYTDNFTITSKHKGEQNIYAAFIDNTGCPTVTRLGTSQCKPDDSGVTISFPVKKEDYSAFAQTAVKVFQYFDPIPVVYGAEVKKPDYAVEKPDYCFFEPGNNYYSRRDISALMGNVRYNINVGNIPDYFPYIYYCLLKFDIGELETTPNREELQYTPDTIKRLKEKAYMIERDAILELEELIGKANITWQERCSRVKAITEIQSRVTINFSRAADYVKDASSVERIKQSLSETGYFQFSPKGVLTDSKVTLSIMLDGNKRAGLAWSTYRSHTKRGDKVIVDYTKNYPVSIRLVPEVKIIYGLTKDTYPDERIKQARTAGLITNDVVVVRPVKVEGATDDDVMEVVKKLKKIFIGITVQPLSDFSYTKPVGSSTGRVRLKKGAAPPAINPGVIKSLDGIDASTVSGMKVYARHIERSRWGNVREYVFLSPEKDYYSSLCISTNHWIDIHKVMKDLFPSLFVTSLTSAEIKQLYIEKRDDWMVMSGFMALEETRKLIGERLEDIYRSKIYPDPDNMRGESFVSSAIKLRHELPNMFESCVKPHMAKVKILKDFETIYKECAKTATTTQAKDNLKYNIDSLLSRFEIEKGDKLEISAIAKLDNKIQQNSSIFTYDVMRNIGLVSEKALNLLVKDVLTKRKENDSTHKDE